MEGVNEDEIVKRVVDNLVAGDGPGIYSLDPAHPTVEGVVRAALAEERKACARIAAETAAHCPEYGKGNHPCEWFGCGSVADIAADIFARGQA